MSILYSRYDVIVCHGSGECCGPMSASVWWRASVVLRVSPPLVNRRRYCECPQMFSWSPAETLHVCVCFVFRFPCHEEITSVARLFAQDLWWTRMRGTGWLRWGAFSPDIRTGMFHATIVYPAWQKGDKLADLYWQGNLVVALGNACAGHWDWSTVFWHLLAFQLDISHGKSCSQAHRGKTWTASQQLLATLEPSMNG